MRLFVGVCGRLNGKFVVVTSMDLLALWSGSATFVWVTVFVVALGLLWFYVMHARPSSSAREYERMERLLSEDSTTTKTPAKTGPGRREGRRGRGKGKTVSEPGLARVATPARPVFQS